ncbi:MAG: 8-amino-7-oxononanoate synthase [Acidimicrobiia bacterium]|nr:8-amino-7-oxononanoate synthase [Acidimicrobiia bacterium]
MSDADWDTWVETQTDRIRAAGQWRAPRDLDAAGPAGTLTADGRAVVHFAGNDYLGLTQHPAVITAAHEALDRWGAGSGAARLIVGSRPVHSELEQALARWKQAETAVLFPTGFAANLGVITSFAGPDVLLCSDELNHASIIDGARLSHAEIAIYPHRDLGALEAVIRERARGRRVVIVSDTVFSMDGDLADTAGLLALADHHGALMVFDEAHAVLGPDLDLDTHARVLRVGTLSKTLGSLGGFVTGPRSMTDLVINRARSYIFTTAPTPADTAAALAAVMIVTSPEGDDLRARLRSNVDQVREGHPSPIIPIMCGSEDRAVAAAAALLTHGLLVPAIRPPTVAPGTSRLRVAISAAHSLDQVRRLRAALDEIAGEPTS